MKVAIVTPVFPPYGGGIGNVAQTHALILSGCGYDVTVFTPDYGRARLAPEKYVLQYVRPLAHFGNAAYLPGLSRHLHGFSLVHFHYPFIGAVRPVVSWRRRNRGRLLLHYHMDLLAVGWKGRVFNFFQHRALPKLIRVADRAAVLSFDYARHGDLKPWVERDPAKFIELPNCVEARRFTPGKKPAEWVARYGLAGKRVVVFVGGLDAAHAFKGVDVLLQAIAVLPADVSCVMVGGGARRREFERLAFTLGIGQRVIFSGAVPAADLPDYYRLADVVVLPSVSRSEAFGLALLEAMSCGRPVVATNLPGVRTVVNDGVNGFLAIPGDANDLAEKISTVLDGLGAAFGEAGRARALTYYDWPVVAGQLLALYQEMVPAGNS